MLLLAACDDNVYYWEFSHEVEYVKEIMIVEMHDEYDYSIIKEIDPEFSDELYSDVKALKMKKYGTNLASPDGLCIMIVFENGDFDVISKKESKHYKIVDDELWIKGINVFDGYAGDDEETALSFEDGYFKTGDLVKVNENGMLYITGRKKEIIVLSSGENVYPAEIENKIYELDTVKDCLVYEYNQSLYLEILPREEVVKNLGITDLQGYYQEKIDEINKTLAPYERINTIIIRSHPNWIMEDVAEECIRKVVDIVSVKVWMQ